MMRQAMIALVLVFAAGSAHADKLYANRVKTLYYVDTDAATATAIGEMGFIFKSLACANATEVFGMRYNGTVYAIDVETAEITPTGVVLPETADITYHPLDGKYYMISRHKGYHCPDANNNNYRPVISTIDLETGESEFVVELDLSSFVELCTTVETEFFGFDDAGNGYLSVLGYYEYSQGWTWMTFDLETGQAEYQGTGGHSGERILDVAPRPEGGLWGAFEHKIPDLTFGGFDPVGFDIRNGRIDALDLDGDDGFFYNLAAVPVTCAADLNGDGVLNVLDFVAFQLLFVDQAPGADCNGDGEFTTLDFVCFQLLFQDGC